MRHERGYVMFFSKKEVENDGEITPFDPSTYFGEQSASPYSDEGIKLQAEGIKKAVEYYIDKYNANITMPLDPDFLEMGMEFPRALSFACNKIECAKLAAHLKEKAKSSLEYREAILFGAGSPHSTPVIYLKQGEEEFYLIADSINKDDNEDIVNFITNSPIPVLNIPGTRQFDNFSCYADAILIARDATARGENGQYRVPNLLEKLKLSIPKDAQGIPFKGKRKNIKNHDYYDAALPDELLKTAQIFDFIDEHKIDKDPIHKGKTLSVFHGEHKEKALKGKWEVSGYLRKKGFKLAHIIEIQHYISEIEKILNRPMEKQIKNEFIAQAKLILRPVKLDQAKERNKIQEEMCSLAQETLIRSKKHKSLNL